MIGGKRNKEQRQLILLIQKEFTKDFSWIDLFSILDQIIDRLDLNYLDLDPQYIEKLVFFYGASRPDSNLKDDFIQFILQSRLQQIIEIKTKDSLIIALDPQFEYLFKNNISNPEWQKTYNDLRNQTKYLENKVDTLKKTLQSTAINEKILNNVSDVNEFKKKIFNSSLNKSYLGLEKYLINLDENKVYPENEIDIFFDDLDIIKNKLINENKELQELNKDIKDIRKEFANFRRSSDIPKTIPKSRETLKIENPQKHKIIKLIQHTITGFLLKNQFKYHDLIALFLKSMNEIILNKEPTERGRGIDLTRFPFEEKGFQISPRESALQELSYANNIDKSPEDPGYLRNSDNMVQFSGLEPFSLRPLDNNRQETDWWVNRFRNKKDYPNKREFNWIYQLY